jgi:polysaccharide biosynthesis protein PslH
MRIYQLLRGLAAGHEVHLLTFSHDPRDAEYLGNLRAICASVNMVNQKRAPALSARNIFGYLSPAPRSYVTDWSLEMQRLVDEIARERDLHAALVFGLRNAAYVSRLDGVAKLLDNENCDTAFTARLAETGDTPMRRFRRRLTWIKSGLYERKLASQFDAVFAVSDDDKNEIDRIAPALAARDAVHVIPNGTDLALLNYRGPQVDMKKIISPGALTYSANYDAARFFCEEVFPLVRSKTPEAQFVITGGTGGVDLTPFQGVEGLTFTGYLDDIRPEVASSAVVVAPARIGGGTRLKILEAMALGVPVVATTF